ncbi:MAG: hypothetical protein L6R28_19355 [Planctomycetes bacterium]|nr:hypothetical protein [Planctomycetota bacterium]
MPRAATLRRRGGLQFLFLGLDLVAELGGQLVVFLLDGALEFQLQVADLGLQRDVLRHALGAAADVLTAIVDLLDQRQDVVLERRVAFGAAEAPAGLELAQGHAAAGALHFLARMSLALLGAGGDAAEQLADREMRLAGQAFFGRTGFAEMDFVPDLALDLGEVHGGFAFFAAFALHAKGSGRLRPSSRPARASGARDAR